MQENKPNSGTNVHNVYTNYELEWREPISDEKKSLSKKF